MSKSKKSQNDFRSLYRIAKIIQAIGFYTGCIAVLVLLGGLSSSLYSANASNGFAGIIGGILTYATGGIIELLIEMFNQSRRQTRLLEYLARQSKKESS